jgi:hypothetical protein
MDFQGFPKIPRYSRECCITEKIDGTNGQIFIGEDCNPLELAAGRIVPFLCGSRNRYIFPENDNHGFAKWAYENEEEILKLGPGRHFGEYWGQGINRGYGLKEKRFSLFNVKKWSDPVVRPACCHVVPVVAEGLFETRLVEDAIDVLRVGGSKAAPGFFPAEGIIIYHVAGNILFKKTLLHDEKPKNLAE